MVSTDRERLHRVDSEPSALLLRHQEKRPTAGHAGPPVELSDDETLALSIY